jgi:HNH endonuclease
MQYISNVVHHRGGTDDDINDINDTRNGLLLSTLLHRPWGAGNLAFLKVYYCYFHSGLLKLTYLI